MNDDAASRSPPDVRQLHPAAGDVVATLAVFELARAHCEAALISGEVDVMAEVLAEVLGAPRNLASAAYVMARIGDEAVQRTYDAQTRDARHAFEVACELLAQQLVDALPAADAARADALGLLSLRSRFARQAAHRPDPSARRWLVMSRKTALDASLEVHDRLLWERSFGTLEIEDRRVELNHANERALSRHVDSRVRTQVAHLRDAYAREREGVFEGLKRARMEWLGESARLLGHAGPFERYVLEAGLSARAIEALDAQRAHTLAFCEDYFTWKREALGLSELYEHDVEISACAPVCALPFEAMYTLLERRAPSHDADYAAVLAEIRNANVIVSDPGASRSADMMCVENAAGGLPIVFAPYRGDAESFAAAAHELGHACHLTVTGRRTGPLALFEAPAWYAETFSLRCEVDALDTARTEASTNAERAFWTEALIDQWLHFMRRLQIAASFDRALFGSPECDASEIGRRRETARRSFSPDFVRPSLPGDGSSDRSWLLWSHQDRVPFVGLEYGLAMAIAWRTHLSGSSLARFADHAAHCTIDEAARRFLDLDIEDPTVFEPIWAHLYGLLEQLKRSGQTDDAP